MLVSTGDSSSVVNDVSDTALASNVSVAVIGAGTMGAGTALSLNWVNRCFLVERANTL